MANIKDIALQDSQSGVRSQYFKEIRSVQCLRTFYTTVVQAWCNCCIHHPLCVRMKLIVNTNLYIIKSFRKLNKVGIDTKFIALPLIKWYFKINFTRCGL